MKRIVEGDVFAIPLGGDRFAYARRCRDESICVFNFITNGISGSFDLDKAQIAFWTGFFWSGGIRNGDWSIVERQRLKDGEGWPPPTRELSVSKNGMRRVSHMGKSFLIPDAQSRDMPFTRSVSPKGLINLVLENQSELRMVDRQSLERVNIEHETKRSTESASSKPKGRRKPS